jgi:hypothetical protein
MGAMSDRLRYYCAGVAHTVALLWVIGWGMSHWLVAPSPVFGPMGWLPVPLALALVFVGYQLLARPGAGRPEQQLQGEDEARATAGRVS